MKFLPCVILKITIMSLPMRERGLKCQRLIVNPKQVRSLPMRERGLKYLYAMHQLSFVYVAPHAGAWIEIDNGSKFKPTSLCRSPCGSVD